MNNPPDDDSAPVDGLSQNTGEYVRLPEAAKRLAVSEDTLDRYAKPGLVSGEIVSYKFGRARSISWPSLLAYFGKYFNGAVPTKRGKR